MPLEMLLYFGPLLFLLALGYGVGTWRERRHFRSLAEREREMAAIPVSNLKRVTQPEGVGQAMFVCGEAVIASDYFKGVIAALRNIVGGEVKVYSRLMERARREATLRMLAQAKRLGATEVWNIRYETSNIMSGMGDRKAAVAVEVLVSGTAIVRR